MRDGSTQREAISEVMDGVTKNYNPRQWLYVTETPLQIVKHIIKHVYLPSVPPPPGNFVNTDIKFCVSW